MKKKINLCATAIGLLFAANTVQAQWTLSGSYVYNNPLTTKVGFGTTTPQVPIDIVGGSGPRFLLYGQGGTTGYQSGMGVNLGQAPNSMGFFIGKNANFSIDVANVSEAFPYTGYTTKFTMLNNGNVGIGATSPIQTLDVNGRINVTNGVIQRGGSAITTTTDLGLYSLNSGTYMRFVTNNAPIKFFTDGGTNPIGNTEKVIITAAGNMGIGVLAPTDKLDVNGSVRINKNVLYLLDAADLNHGLGYFGTNLFTTTGNYANKNFDGPVLFGFNGGALGTTQGANRNVALSWLNNGNVGIGVQNPTTSLDVYQASTTNTLNTALKLGANMYGVNSGPFIDFNLRYQGGFTNWIGGRIGSVYETSSSSNNSAALVFYTNNNNDGNAGPDGTTEKMRILGNGAMLIGTVNYTGYLLAVNGSVRAKSLKIDSNWADFVFEKNYELRPLKEVEKFIQENGHLPEIPTTKEVTENGIDVGEMNAKLLQKVEELTLYVIELEKKVNGMNQK